MFWCKNISVIIIILISNANLGSGTSLRVKKSKDFIRTIARLLCLDSLFLPRKAMGGGGLIEKSSPVE